MSRGPWVEAMEVQAVLADAIARPGPVRRYVDYYDEDVLGFGIAEIEGGRRTWSLAEFLADGLATADSYWIAEEMLDVVDAAAATMPPERLYLEDLPTPGGFALTVPGRLCRAHERMPA